MEPLGISVVRADESYGYAKYYYDEGPTVYIEVTGINSSQSKWRIRGRQSLGDSNVYLEGQGLGTFTFDSDNNMSYIFQIQNFGGQWVNTSQTADGEVENSILNVVFESGGSGGSGGEDDYSDTPYTLHISKDDGIEYLKVIRTDSKNGYYGDIPLESGDLIYYDGVDTFAFIVEVKDGYELDYYEFDGKLLGYKLENFEKYIPLIDDGIDYYQLAYPGDAYVTATSKPIATARIYNESSESWDIYAPFIYSEDSGWERYTPFIYYTDSGWESIVK